MFKDYYQQQLTRLKQDAKTFSEQNPQHAGFLGELSSEPDIQQLLQGFAFLSANVRRQVDAHYPKLLHAIMRVVSPQKLKPYPSVCLLEFKPKVNMLSSVEIPAFSEVSSQNSPYYRFRLTKDLVVNPIILNKTTYQNDEQKLGPEQNFELRLDFSVQGGVLKDLATDFFEITADAEFNEASNVIHFLHTQVEKVYVLVNDKVVFISNEKLIKPSGFQKEEVLFPDKNIDLPVFDLLTDFFVFPEKFLAFSLEVSSWRDQVDAEKFSIVLSGYDTGFDMPKEKHDLFKLHCVPIVNLYRGSAEPKLLEQVDEQILMVPSARADKDYPQQIYNIEHVNCVVRGETEGQVIKPFNEVSMDSSSAYRYQVDYQPAINKAGYELYLSFSNNLYMQSGKRRVLRADLTLFNEDAVEQLRPGEITKSVGDTPELVEFSNSTTPTVCCQPSIDDNRLWHIISDMNFNLSSLTNIEVLKALLLNYVPKDTRNESKYLSNQRMINSLCSISTENQERLFKTKVLRGIEITVILKKQEFVSPGMVYLFGNMLSELFTNYAAINNYTAMSLKDYYSGAIQQWPARLGTKTLI